MSTATAAPPGGAAAPEPSVGPRPANWAKVGLGVLGMVAVVWFASNAFLAFAYYPQWFFDSKLLIGLLALVVGVGGAYLFFWALNVAIEGLPDGLSRGLMPYAYVVPGLALVALMLIYPAAQTINYSFANADSTEYVGFQNYRDIFSDQEFWDSILNNVLWLIVAPAAVVAFGVIVAVLADRLSPNGEKVTKSIIFLPMAISFVGASAIWSLVYFVSSGDEQIGLLNAIWTTVGGSPIDWLHTDTARLNSFAMMVILIWLQVGFAMILLSSAIKGVPEETIEAARIDGATEWQIFWQVQIPQIKGTIITVYVTVLILVLKIFDIVYVLTNGNFKSNVIANLFYNELFANDQAGRASAIVVVLLIAVMPVLVYQVRHFRKEEMGR